MNSADGNLESQPENTSVNDFDLAKIDPIAAAIYRGWPGIPWAGGIYGMSIVAVIALFEAMTIGRFPVGIGWLLCLLPFFIGALIATFTGIVSAYLCWIFHRTFLGLVCGRTAVSISGGLAGFLSTAWVGLIGFPQFLWLAFVFGAMIFGQAGAIWSASPSRDWNQMALNSGDGVFQFDIKHMLIMFIWVSVVLGFNQLSHSNNFVVAVCFYVSAQFILVVLDRQIYFLRKRWRKAS